MVFVIYLFKTLSDSLRYIAVAACCHSTKLIERSKSLSVLNCNFSKEQSMLPEDDRMTETCRSVLSVLM